MRPKSMLLLALALGCGLVASIGISQVMDKRSKQTGPAAPETESIYVALSDINLGDTISAEMLELQDWPKDKIQPGAVREIDEVVGRKPRTKIYQGDPILEAKLVSADAPDAPSEQIPPGYRTFAVKVTEEAGTAGLARAGDRVDVQLFVKKDERKNIPETKVHTILENVRVFAVDQVFRRGTEQEEGGMIAKTITLVITPRESSMLNLAAGVGDIRLVLRNPDDELASEESEVTMEDLFANSSKADESAERGETEDEGEEKSGLA
ncbi:MAG: Flp pilus assembly protein CpaB, partial [Planctomycetales bacterium]|nr:Flp pilus assembly protein CpaB [Planctomycetales bacterium]